MNNKYIYLGDNKIVPLDDHAIFIMGDDWIRGRYKQWLGEEYIASLPKIEVVKEPTHSWEINQILVEGEENDFELDFYRPLDCNCEKNKNGNCIDCIDTSRVIAVPISKPNTDVKQNEFLKFLEAEKTRYCKEQFEAKGKRDREVAQGIFEELAVISHAFDKHYKTISNPVKEGERLYSKEDAIGFAEYANNENYSYLGEGTWEGDCERLISSQDLFSEYLSSPEFKNNQL